MLSLAGAFGRTGGRSRQLVVAINALLADSDHGVGGCRRRVDGSNALRVDLVHPAGPAESR